MRNQSWLPNGTLVRDIEIVRQNGQIVAIDHLLNNQRPATRDEQNALLSEEQAATRLPLEERVMNLEATIIALKAKVRIP